MVIEFKEIMDAFDFVSFGQMYEHQAFLDKETGKIYWHSEFGDNEEELPEDIDDGKYIEIPHKNELDLGKALVLDFAYEYLPNSIDAFLTTEQLIRELQESGFKLEHVASFSFGISTLFIARKV